MAGVFRSTKVDPAPLGLTHDVTREHSSYSPPQLYTRFYIFLRKNLTFPAGQIQNTEQNNRIKRILYLIITILSFKEENGDHVSKKKENKLHLQEVLKHRDQGGTKKSRNESTDCSTHSENNLPCICHFYTLW